VSGWVDEWEGVWFGEVFFFLVVVVGGVFGCFVLVFEGLCWLVFGGYWYVGGVW